MHFFVDPTGLFVQTSAEKFGPVDGHESLQYKVTSRFQLSGSGAAFACESGLLIVQQSDESPALVNLILTPLNGRSKVKYYIYRGIAKSTLITLDGAEVIPPNPTNIELVNRIYNSIAGVLSYTANILGFDNNILPGDTHIEEIFHSSSNFRAIHVLEGELIGEFVSDAAGFEVILETDKINIDLDYVRKPEHVIDIDGLSGLELKASREEILYYVDPVAFFGSYHSIGVKVSSYSGEGKATVNKKENDLYNGVLSKFATSDTLYLDIRSDKGYSYNFYGDYDDGSGNNIQFSSSPEAYGTQGWPIIIKENVTNLSIKLRTDGNVRPIFFIDQKELKTENDNSAFVAKLNELNLGWTKEINLSVPFPSSYIKAHYYHQIIDQTSPSPFVKNNRYYNNAFCSIDVLPEITESTFANKGFGGDNYHYISETLQGNNSGGFGYVAKNGAFWDSNRILFYSELICQYTGSGRRFSPSKHSTLTLDNSAYLKKFKSNLDVNCLLFKKFISQNTYEDIKILSVNNYTGIANRQETENIMFLGLSINEMSAVELAMATISGNHHKYFFLEPTTSIPLTQKGEDFKQNFFYEYRLKIQGLDSEGNLQYATPVLSSDEILVYSRDNFFFNSKAFSLSEPVTEVISNDTPSNNLEYHIYPDGKIKIINQDQLQKGKFADYYYHADNTDSVMICRFQIVKSTIKLLGKRVNSPPVPSDVKDTISYDNPEVWAKTSWVLNDNSVITLGRSETSQTAPNNLYMFYENVGMVSYMIYFDQTIIQIAQPEINFVFKKTERFYFKPDVAAGFIGALIRLSPMSIVSEGSSYKDGSCFPSQTHINGKAVDVWYQSTDKESQLIIDTMIDFGFNTVYKGSSYPNLKRAIEKPKHNGHLHFHNFKIKIK